MASGKNVRIQLSFANIPKLPQKRPLKCWFLVNTNITETIAELCTEISARFALEKNITTELYLDGALLPSSESIAILRDNDHIRVSRKQWCTSEIEINTASPQQRDNCSRKIHEDAVLLKDQSESAINRLSNKNEEEQEYSEHGERDESSIELVAQSPYNSISVNQDANERVDDRSVVSASDSSENAIVLEESEITEAREVVELVATPNIDTTPKKKRKRKRSKKKSKDEGIENSSSFVYTPNNSVFESTPQRSEADQDTSKAQHEWKKQSNKNFAKKKWDEENKKHVRFDSEGSGEETKEEEGTFLEHGSIQLKAESVQNVLNTVTDHAFPCQEVSVPAVKRRKCEDQPKENKWQQNRVHWNYAENKVNEENSNHNGESETSFKTPSFKTFAKGPFANVKVFNRKERRQHKKNANYSLTKEEQLSTVATNVSVIYQNEAHGEDAVEASEEAPLPVKDYSGFSLLHGPPRPGDIIAYKILEMSENYCPEISDFKEAKVLGYNPEMQSLDLEHTNTGQKKNMQGRFDMILEDDEDVLTNQQGMSNVTLSWTSLIDTRLVTA